jgi:hypothetical protein
MKKLASLYSARAPVHVSVRALLDVTYSVGELRTEFFTAFPSFCCGQAVVKAKEKARKTRTHAAALPYI